MRILFLATRYPYPILKGDQLRVANFLHQLVNHGHQVDFVCSAETAAGVHDSLPEFPSGLNTIIVTGFGLFERYINLLRPLWTREPFEVSYFYNRQMQRQVDRLLHDHRYDAVFCQMVRSAPYVRKRRGITKIIDYQDAYSLNMQKRYLSERGAVKWVAWLEWQLLRRYEQDLLSDFDQTMIIAQRDKDVINAADMAVVGNGVTATNGISVKPEARQLVFSGNLKYFPNREAAVWFATEVFPNVRQQLPGVTLKITGATPPDDVVGLGQLEGVTVVADPPDMLAEIATAQVAVAPMLSGSGLQNKVLEAMAVGLPVVVTQHALDGLDPSARDVLVCSEAEPAAMSQQVVALLNDRQTCTRLGQAGQQYIQQHHSWQTIGRQVDALLGKLSSES